jgi:RNA polymerase sigma-70 factor (ECF subfamily)
MEKLQDLLAKIKNADADAFRQVFDLYVKKVYNFIFNYIKNKSDTEDLTQNVFLKIWEKRATLDLDKSLDSYVFTIAYHMVVDYFRKTNNSILSSLSEDIDIKAPISVLSAEDSLNKHQIDSLYQAGLDLLPPKRKEIFLLSRHQGLTNKQIADYLHISVKTVENQMTAALKSLKEFFDNNELLFILVSLNYFL